LDFQKTFDRVPQKRLIRKLYRPEVKGKLLFWGRDWLETENKEEE